MNIRYYLLLSLLLLSLFSAPIWAQDEESTPVLRFGVLPVLNTLPLYVAEAAGYFEEAGVAVQIGRFRSAAKLRSAVRQEEMDGFQADLVSALKLHESGQGLQVVRHVASPIPPFSHWLPGPGVGSRPWIIWKARESASPMTR